MSNVSINFEWRRRYGQPRLGFVRWGSLLSIESCGCLLSSGVTGQHRHRCAHRLYICIYIYVHLSVYLCIYTYVYIYIYDSLSGPCPPQRHMGTCQFPRCCVETLSKQIHPKHFWSFEGVCANYSHHGPWRVYHPVSEPPWMTPFPEVNALRVPRASFGVIENGFGSFR